MICVTRGTWIAVSVASFALEPMTGSPKPIDSEVRTAAFRENRPIHLESAVVPETPARLRIHATSGFIHIPATGKSLRDIEREAIELTMSLTEQNQSAAARILGISRPTLLRKRREHGVTGENLGGTGSALSDPDTKKDLLLPLRRLHRRDTRADPSPP